MSPEPRFEGEYALRQVEAAHRVLVDVGQVLASFGDTFVVVGGWVPFLLFPSAASLHIGSIDVDLALDAEKLADGRYEPGDQHFQLAITVDLGDGEQPIRVDVEFLASSDIVLKKNRPKVIEGFRALRHAAFAAAFTSPVTVDVTGTMISGASNTVHFQVASLPGFPVMKAHAIGGRDKPKDVYDLCYCLDEFPEAIDEVATDWKVRHGDSRVAGAIAILKEKFQSVDHYGPQQLALFHSGSSPDDGEMHARRAYELVQKLLSLL